MQPGVMRIGRLERGRLTGARRQPKPTSRAESVTSGGVGSRWEGVPILRIRVVIAGKVRERYLREGAAEYLKRLGPYAKVELVEVQDEPVPERASEKDLASARDVEAERILRAVRDGDYLVAMDIRGKQMSSEDLSRWLQERSLSGDSSLVFAIGGTTGLSDAVLKKARLRLSMGPMTFPHQFMPLLLLEQLYRAVKIGEGEPYHR